MMKPNDQLTKQRLRKSAFADFEEGPLSFLPTYKYDNGTDDFDSSEKHRAPAWTDRILSKGKGIHQRSYRSIQQLRSSDHKPVCAMYAVDVKQIDEPKRLQLLKSLYKSSVQDSLVARSPGHGPTASTSPIPLPPRTADLLNTVKPPNLPPKDLLPSHQPVYTFPFGSTSSKDNAMADLLDLAPLTLQTQGTPSHIAPPPYSQQTISTSLPSSSSKSGPIRASMAASLMPPLIPTPQALAQAPPLTPLNGGGPPPALPPRR